MINQLPDISTFDEVGEQAVARAARQGQGVGNGEEARAFALRRKEIKNSQAVLKRHFSQIIMM